MTNTSETPDQGDVTRRKLKMEVDIRQVAVVALAIMAMMLIVFISILSGYSKEIPESLTAALGASIGALAGIVAQQK